MSSVVSAGRTAALDCRRVMTSTRSMNGVTLNRHDFASARSGRVLTLFCERQSRREEGNQFQFLKSSLR